jgi:hypothetical protein
MELSSEAKTALINATGRQGAPVTTPNSVVKLELTRLGLVTHASNLTRSGLSARARVLAAALDAAF